MDGSSMVLRAGGLIVCFDAWSAPAERCAYVSRFVPLTPQERNISTNQVDSCTRADRPRALIQSVCRGKAPRSRERCKTLNTSTGRRAADRLSGRPRWGHSLWIPIADWLILPNNGLPANGLSIDCGLGLFVSFFSISTSFSVSVFSIILFSESAFFGFSLLIIQ